MRIENIKKRAQVTIFIILGILIVIVLLFIFIGRDDFTSLFTAKTPIDQFESCLVESLEDGMEIIRPQGGSIEPEHYILYQDNKVEYLCYTTEIYAPCKMQKPLVKKSVEAELKKYTEVETKKCLEGVRAGLEKRGYSVEFDAPVIDIKIIPENVFADMILNLRITKDTTESYESLKTNIESNLYRLTMVAGSILNIETKYGDTEIMTYMINNPSLRVEKIKQIDDTKVYILTVRDTEENFMFAVRSVPFPPGITGT